MHWLGRVGYACRSGRACTYRLSTAAASGRVLPSAAQLGLLLPANLGGRNHNSVSSNHASLFARLCDNHHLTTRTFTKKHVPTPPPPSSLPAKALGGTPDHHHGSSRAGLGMSGIGARFHPSDYQAKASGFFGGGESPPAGFGGGAPGAPMTASSPRGGAGAGAGSGLGQGMLGLSSFKEKEEDAAGAVSPANGRWFVGGMARERGGRGGVGVAYRSRSSGCGRRKARRASRAAAPLIYGCGVAG